MMLVAGAVSVAQSSVLDASSVEVVMELRRVMHPLLSLAVTGAAVLSCAEILGLPVNRWMAALLLESWETR